MIRKTMIGLGAAVSALCIAPSAQAQDWYIGQILDVGFTYCPRNTIEAAGQTVAITSNTALFSLYGTTYGGDGITNFKLPDLRGRAPIGQGQGPGLTNYPQGTAAGTETVTLTTDQMPAHTHAGVVRAVNGAPDTDDPTNATLADFPSGTPIYNNTTAPNVNMAAGTVMTTPTGGNLPFPNRSPYLALRYCVVLYGIFPSRP